MSFMRKMLDVLNMDNWNTKNKDEFKSEKEEILGSLQSKLTNASKLINMAQNANNKEDFYSYINEIENLFCEQEKNHNRKTDNAYEKYYENIRKQKESNLHITYEDVKIYNAKPFDLNAPFISDEHFTAIELSGSNLEIAYNYLSEINSLLLSYKYLYEDADFPPKISVEYISNRELPISHLRLIPYTATMRKSKYPLALWLSNSGYYGTEYIYAIYFDQEGNIGQCELSLHGSGGIGISYETKIGRNENGLYILRISKTLYSPPYGTTTIYHCKDDANVPESIKDTNKSKPKAKHMSKYEIEQYAKECNAYAIRAERIEQNNND